MKKRFLTDLLGSLRSFGPTHVRNIDALLSPDQIEWWGDEGCLSLFGNQPERQRLLAEQLTAEYPMTTSGRGRTVEEWKQRPDRPDNHWFDCLVGSAVAGSMLGAKLASEWRVKPIRKRHTLEELQRIANRPTARDLARQAQRPK